jgi:hypothetical protein
MADPDGFGPGEGCEPAGAKRHGRRRLPQGMPARGGQRGGRGKAQSLPARTKEARAEAQRVVLPQMVAEPAPAPSEAERLQEQRFAAALKLLHPKLRKRFAGKRTFARAVQRRAEPLQWQIQPPEAMAEAEQRPLAADPWHRFSPEAKAALEAGAKARAAWKPPSKPTGFAKAEERDKAWVQRAADALIPMLPPAVAEAMAGRDDGQLSSYDRAWQARAAIVRQAGRSGNRAEVLIDVSKMLVFMEAFARTLGVQMFPMQPAMVAMIVGGEHARATAAGTGSRGGTTTGARIRSTIQMMADNFEFPIDYDAPCVWGAAPAAKAGGGRQSVAAAAPLKVSLHTMRLARSPHPSPGRYVARSMVFAEIAGARVQDCERLVLARDARPNVMSAKAYTAKDGEPLELFAYARDFFGIIPWYMWVPRGGDFLFASRPVWLQGKGPEPPGFLPALSGHGERIAGLTAPLPVGTRALHPPAMHREVT